MAAEGIKSTREILSTEEILKELAAPRHLAGAWKGANSLWVCANVISFVALGTCSLLLPVWLLSAYIASSQLQCLALALRPCDPPVAQMACPWFYV